MKLQLRRYWFEFDISDQDLQRYSTYSGLRRGCGVTAYNYEGALLLLDQQIFRGDPTPRIQRVVENVDVLSLDEHILPNIGVPIWRGIWFPRL